MKPKLIAITPVRHISGVPEALESFADVTYMDDPSPDELYSVINNYNIIFTNPNKSQIFIGKELIDKGKNISIICTASTGTNHVDLNYVKEKNIKFLSLTEERDIIDKISSTAEHAFALTLSAIRHIPFSFKDVLGGSWNYEKFIGRQLNGLTIGIVGYGRLGSLYSKYCIPFDPKILVFDPYKKVNNDKIFQVDNVEDLLVKCDVISFHVHVNEETINMIDSSWLKKMKKDVILVNTSRGDIFNEGDLIEFLKNNNHARYATDVLANEILSKKDNSVIEYARNSNQIIITPHIGGMTKEAQEIAYNHAAKLCKEFALTKLV